LPEDWKLSEELWRYGTSLGLRGHDLEEEEAKIKLWCRQQDHRCVDRNAFVQLWLRRTAAKKPGLPKGDADGYADFLNGAST
jgi:hypothetical protein